MKKQRHSHGRGRSARPSDAAASSHPSPPARKRGGQPGNRNAVKHGFYSAVLKAHERSMLAALPIADLSAEIDLIRITNRRFLQALQATKSDLDLETQLTALRAVNLSAHSIASLLRARALTAAVSGEAAEALGDL